MKKLLVIVSFLLVQNGLAAENPDCGNIAKNHCTQYRLLLIPMDIHSLLEQGRISDAYTKAAELKTRDDIYALRSKCYLAALLRSFPAEEACLFALYSGVDKDKSYERAIVESSLLELLELHHRCMFSGNFESSMKAKEACKFLLGRHKDYTYTACGKSLSFKEVEENIKTTDDAGRALLNGRDSGHGDFFYPDDRETALKIYSEERDMLPEDDYVDCDSD